MSSSFDPRDRSTLMHDSPPDRRHLRRAPNRRELALIVGLALVLNLAPGTFLQLLHLRWGLLATQAMFIAGPVLVAIRRFDLDRRAVLPLRRPGALAIVGTVAGTLGLNHILTLLGTWQERLWPAPESFRAFFENIFVYQGAFDFAVLIALFAVVPAVCEEILFRGFLQNGLIEALGSPAKGILLSAAIFAVFHVDPWRFSEILILGAFFGYLAYRSGSIIPPMIGHALNNGVSITAAMTGERPHGFPGAGFLAAVAILLIAVSLSALRRAPRGPRASRML